MYKEEEAKEKWCPIAVPLIAADPQSMSEDISNCIASGCMMWRWNSTDQVYGYCGLAGKEKQ